VGSLRWVWLPASAPRCPVGSRLETGRGAHTPLGAMWCPRGVGERMSSRQRWHEVLSELHELVGAPGGRVVEEHARRDPDAAALSKSTVSTLLKGEANPRRATVRAFVLGCLSYARAHRRTVALPDGQDMAEFWMRRY